MKKNLGSSNKNRFMERESTGPGGGDSARSGSKQQKKVKSKQASLPLEKNQGNGRKNIETRLGPDYQTKK